MKYAKLLKFFFGILVLASLSLQSSSAMHEGEEEKRRIVSTSMKVCAHQKQELKELKNKLCPKYQSEEDWRDFDVLKSPVQDQAWLAFGSRIEEAEKSLETYNQVVIFDQIEDLLNEVNTSLIQMLVLKKLPLYGDESSLSDLSDLDLSNMITRLSPAGIRHIQTWIAELNETVKMSPFAFSGISIDLSRNNLRWLPDELFAIPLEGKSLTLNLNNNLLTSLPESIENFQELTELYLENLEGVSGNVMKELPTSILKLTKLEALYCEGLGLRTLPPGIFTQLPKLVLLHLANNNLDPIPTAPQGRNIQITGIEDDNSEPNKFTRPCISLLAHVIYTTRYITYALPFGVILHDILTSPIEESTFTIALISVIGLDYLNRIFHEKEIL